MYTREPTFFARVNTAVQEDRDKPAHRGIVNQGATCYLNSLLQSMYHIPYLRQAIFKVDTEKDEPDSLMLAMQELYYNLLTKSGPASTKNLTAAFGWDDSDAHIQHDAQEMARILGEKLNDRMKGTSVHRAVDKLYCGTQVNYIRCLDVSHVSSRIEKFLDLTLTVKGHRNIYEALDSYVKPEVLDGDNKYMVENGSHRQYSKALKGVHFKSLPPILVIHLNRMEIDMTSEDLTTKKVNSLFEFPEELDMDPYLQPGSGFGRTASFANDREVTDTLKRRDSLDALRGSFFRSSESKCDIPKWSYTLQAVLVHKGTPFSGHYYTFIRPECTQIPSSTSPTSSRMRTFSQPANDTTRGWVKFDDDKVTNSNIEEAVNENYGGEFLDWDGTWKENNSSAYMLCYIRTSLLDKIMKPLDDGTIPSVSLINRLQTREKVPSKSVISRAPRNTSVKVFITVSKDLHKHVDYSAKSLFPIMAAVDTTITISKEALFGELVRNVASQLRMSEDSFRVWVFGRKTNASPEFQPARITKAHFDIPVSASRALDFDRACHDLVERHIFVEEAAKEIFPTTGRDIVPLSTVRQSSDWSTSHQAINAVAKDIGNAIPTRTAAQDVKPWFEIEFHTQIPRINKILIYGAVDEGESLDGPDTPMSKKKSVSFDKTPHSDKQRLKEITVEVLDASRRVVWSSGPHSRWKSLSIDFDALGMQMSGRRVKISRNAANEDSDKTLSLQLVRVYTSSSEVSLTCLPTISDSILLFVKKYDPSSRTTSYCGNVVVEKSSVIMALMPIMNNFLGQGRMDSLLMFREETPRNLMNVDLLERVKDNHLENGDTIVVQKTPAAHASSPFPTAKAYWKHISSQRRISFANQEAPDQISCTLTLADSDTYEAIQDQLARNLGNVRNHKHLQLFSHDFFSGKACQSAEPRTKNGASTDLVSMIRRNGAVSRKMYYKVLNHTVEEYESQIFVKLHCFSFAVEEIMVLECSLGNDVPLPCRVQDVLTFAAKQLGSRAQGNLMMAPVRESVISDVCDPQEMFITSKDEIDDELEWRVDPIPNPVVLNDYPDADQRMIGVCHAHITQSLSGEDVEFHGKPFVMYITEMDTGASVKHRIRMRLGWPDSQMKRHQLIAIRAEIPIDIADDDDVYDALEKSEEFENQVTWAPLLALKSTQALGNVRQASGGLVTKPSGINIR